MKTDDVKRTYRSRAGLCALVNAHLKSHHGTAQVSLFAGISGHLLSASGSFIVGTP